MLLRVVVEMGWIKVEKPITSRGGPKPRTLTNKALSPHGELESNQVCQLDQNQYAIFAGPRYIMRQLAAYCVVLWVLVQWSECH